MSRQEFNLQFLSDFSEIWICSNQSRAQLLSQARRKAIGIRKSVDRFVFSSRCCPIPVRRNNVQCELLYTANHPLGFRFASGFSHRINHFTPVYRGHKYGHLRSRRFLQQSIYPFRPRPVRQQNQKRIGIQNIAPHRPRSRSRRLSSCKKSKAAAAPGREPRTFRMASARKGCRTMLPSLSSPKTILMRIPFLRPSFRRTWDGSTTCPRELIVVVYTSVFLAVFRLILLSYPKVRRSSFQNLADVPGGNGPAWPNCPSALPPLLPCASIPPLRRADQGFFLFSFAPLAGTQVGRALLQTKTLTRRRPAPVSSLGGPSPGDLVWSHLRGGLS